MAKAFFLAVGLSLCLLGGECFVVEKAVLAAKAKPKEAAKSNSFLVGTSTAPKKRVIKTPEWAPWTFLSAGAVIVLYSITLTRND